MEHPHPPHSISLAACGAVTALGAAFEEPLEAALRANASGLAPHESLAGRGYQSIVSGMVPATVLEQLRAADPTHADARAFLLADAALKEADLRFASVPPSRRGLVLSTTKADIEVFERLVGHQQVSARVRRHMQPALLAADLAGAHDVKGPVQCVSAACISGLLALQQGAALLRRQEADLVWVVGVDLVSHFVLAGFATLKSLEPEGCRPFDIARAGLSLGEGAGALALVRNDSGFSGDVQVLGGGVSNDANHLTGPSRDGSGLALAIGRALGEAQTTAEEIDYAHMHGTGTPYNDAMESHALRAVFGERVPPFSSSKGMLGHTLGAAGILETILCWLAMKARMLPGTPRLNQRDPVVPDSLVTMPRTADRLRRVLKVNCGFAGTNAAVILGG